MKCPDILDRDRIGKHCAISKKLQLILYCDGNKYDRPAETGRYDNSAQDIGVGSKSRRGHDATFPLTARKALAIEKLLKIVAGHFGGLIQQALPEFC